MEVHPMATDPSTTEKPTPENEDELGFDPDSPDLDDPQVDPTHPARTSNDPEPTPQIRGGENDVTKRGNGVD